MKQLSRLLLPPTLPVQEEKEEIEKPSTFLVQQQQGKWENRATFWKKNKKKKNEKSEHLSDRR
jgi:hypothetical protein